MSGAIVDVIYLGHHNSLCRGTLGGWHCCVAAPRRRAVVEARRRTHLVAVPLRCRAPGVCLSVGLHSFEESKSIIVCDSLGAGTGDSVVMLVNTEGTHHLVLGFQDLVKVLGLRVEGFSRVHLVRCFEVA